MTPGNAQATISWVAPVSDGGSAITGYTATANNGASCLAAAIFLPRGPVDTTSSTTTP